MRTILQERRRGGGRDIHCNILYFVHKVIPMPQAVKILAAKSSSGEGMGKIGKDFGVAPDESQRFSMKQGRRAQKFISPH